MCVAAEAATGDETISLVRERNLPVPVVEFLVEDIVRSGLCAMWVRAFEDKGAPALARLEAGRR
jgi:phosphate starvation-inducible PhoH-like protein